MFEQWYEKDSKAFGYPEDIRAGALVFEQIAQAMEEGRRGVLSLNSAGSDVWAGESADEMRAGLDGLPELMRTSGIAHADAGAALRDFAPAMDVYQRNHVRLQSDARRAQRDIDHKTMQLRGVHRRLDRDDNAWEWLGDLVSLGATNRRELQNDPEGAMLLRALDELEAELESLKDQFRRGRDDFTAEAKRAERRINDADLILYNNAWDKFLSQNIEPVLDVVKDILGWIGTVLAIGSILLLGVSGPLAAAVGTAGMIVAGLAATVSLLHIIGTTAAGREIPKDLAKEFFWNSLGFALAGAGEFLGVAASGSRQFAAALFATAGDAVTIGTGPLAGFFGKAVAVDRAHGWQGLADA